MMEHQPAGPAQPMPAAPDETGYYMHVPERTDNWIYGDPGQNGQTPSFPPAAVPQSAMPAEPALPAGAAQAPMPGMNGGEILCGVSSAAAQSQRMKNPVDMAHTHMPSGADEAYQASLRSLLNRNVGYFVEATFLVGPDRPITWKGILHTVGSDYLVLYQPDFERYISGDLYSLKFVQFHNVKGVPYCSASQSWQGQL